jgi:hypothetical protein
MELFVPYGGARLFALHSVCVPEIVNTCLQAFQLLVKTT